MSIGLMAEKVATAEKLDEIRASIAIPLINHPWTPPPDLPTHIDHLRSNMAEAIAAFVQAEVARQLAARSPEAAEPVGTKSAPASEPPPAPVPAPVTPPHPPRGWKREKERNISMPQPPPAEKPVAPSVARVIRQHAVEEPAESVAVDEPDDPINAHRNLGMRAAIAIAHRLGCRVRKNSAGELEFSHPFYFRRLRVHHGRHTAPRVLLTMLRVVEESNKAGRPVREGPTGSV